MDFDGFFFGFWWILIDFDGDFLSWSPVRTKDVFVEFVPHLTGSGSVQHGNDGNGNLCIIYRWLMMIISFKPCIFVMFCWCPSHVWLPECILMKVFNKEKIIEVNGFSIFFGIFQSRGWLPSWGKRLLGQKSINIISTWWRTTHLVSGL